MTTHENDIPDEDLPGAGVFDPEYTRQRLRESEEAGILLWDDEANTYRTSARGIMFGIGMACLNAAQEIDPEADQETIMGTVTKCLPWEAKAAMVTELVDLDKTVAALEMPNPDDVGFKVPETLPEDWTI